MVLIDEPNVPDQSTGGHATTLTHDLWVDMLPYLNLYPDRTDGAEETEALPAESPLQKPIELPVR